jgi:hypothetical protein
VGLVGSEKVEDDDDNSEDGFNAVDVYADVGVVDEFNEDVDVDNEKIFGDGNDVVDVDNGDDREVEDEIIEAILFSLVLAIVSDTVASSSVSAVLVSITAFAIFVGGTIVADGLRIPSTSQPPPLTSDPLTTNP